MEEATMPEKTISIAKAAEMAQQAAEAWEKV